MPAEDDPTGERFTFGVGADKRSGGSGWADVWKRGYFAWEYRGRHAGLDKAYQQLLQYWESLQNPPLLIVSDIDRIVVHTNFTNTVKQVIEIGLDDLLTPEGQCQLGDGNHRCAEAVPSAEEHAAAHEAGGGLLLRADEVLAVLGADFQVMWFRWCMRC